MDIFSMENPQYHPPRPLHGMPNSPKIHGKIIIYFEKLSKNKIEKWPFSERFILIFDTNLWTLWIHGIQGTFQNKINRPWNLRNKIFLEIHGNHGNHGTENTLYSALNNLYTHSLSTQ